MPKFRSQEPEKESLADVQTQAYAKFFGDAFAQRFDAPIQFLDKWHVEIQGCPISRYFTLEPFVEGNYETYGSDGGEAKWTEAFSCFTWWFSGLGSESIL